MLRGIFTILTRYGGRISTFLAGTQVKDAWDWVMGEDSDEAKSARVAYRGFFFFIVAFLALLAAFLFGKKKGRKR
jgi:hypothetical protein